MKSVLLMFALVLACLTTPVTMVAQDSEARHLYDSLHAMLESGDTLIDYHEFRMAYTGTELYSPYDTRDDERAMFAAMDDENWEEALKKGKQALEKNYTSMRTHYGISYVYKQLNQPKKSRIHRAIELGLLRAIMRTGDGDTPETAWRVISVDEEYFILGVFGMKFTGQALIQSDEGEPVDQMDVIDTESGEKLSYYFNVSLSFNYLHKQLNTEE